MSALEVQVENGLTQLIVEAERRLSKLNEQKRALDLRISMQLARIRALELARSSLSDEGSANRPQLHLVTSDPVSKREAVLSFLAERPDQDFRLVEIRRGLIGRGWIEDNKRAIHALEVAVTKMAQRGEITRVRKGIYRLAPNRGYETAGLTNSLSRAGDVR